MTRIKMVDDDQGRYCGIEIQCHAGHTHFISTTWTPPGKVRSPLYPANAPSNWTFNGDFNSPSVSPSVRTRSGHFSHPGGKPGNCYCDYQQRYPDKEPLPEKWYCYNCHFVLTAGIVNYCSDCSHEYKDKQLPLNS